mgnify:CR=1 FL=1
MFNVCHACGLYRADKHIEAVGEPGLADAICPECGHRHRFRRLPLLVLSGAVTIATATLLPLAQLGALVVFTLVGSLGVAAPLLASLLLGERANAPLLRSKAWMMRNNATIMAVVLAVLGVVVTANGVAKL